MNADRAVVDELRRIVGRAHVLVEDDLVAGYVRDWTGRWVGETAGVVRPGSHDEVRSVVRLCNELGLALVPQGGNTGLVGGSVPHRGEMVISLRRLDHLGPVDSARMEVTMGAGATLGAVQGHARSSGLEYGVDLASRDSATVGGTIATNAGGMNVVANGDTRRQVIGLEVVFGDGSVGSRLDGVAKESTGPDPLQLMVGSEGSLGIITRARLRLVPRPVEMMVTLIGVGSLAEGLSCLPESGVHAAEFFDRRCLDAVIEHRGLSRPLSSDAPLYVLVESSEPPVLADDADAVVDRRLWAYRESITETVNQIGVPVKLDVAVPIDRMDDLVAAVTGLRLDGDVYLWGHLVEGNFHVNVLGDPDPGQVVDRVLEVVIGIGGVIASEHGIGVAKADWWRRSRDPATLEMLRRIKDTFDPRHILNPEVFWGG